MKMLSLLKLFIISFLISNGKSEVSVSTRDYIHNKWKETDESYSKIISENVQQLGEIENWLRLWSDVSDENCPGLIVSSNQMYLIEEEQISYISSNFYDMQVVNELSYLTNSKEPVKFVKNYDWKGSTFLLVCQTSSCVHYQGNNISEFKNNQTMQYDNLVPIDASFFSLQKQLYLAITYGYVNFTVNGPTPTKIYIWGGTSSMTFIDEYITNSAKSLSTFNTKESTILVLTSEYENKETSCILYEFKTFAEPIKYLKTINSVLSVYTYYYKEESFILITDENTSGIYKWNGLDFERYMTIPEIKSPNSVSVVNVNDETIMFVINVNTINIYKIEKNEYTYLDRLHFQEAQLTDIRNIKILEYQGLIRMMIVKHYSDDTFQIELWQTYFGEQFEIIKPDEISHCFEEIQNLLSAQRPIVEDLKKSWPELLPFLQNSSITAPLQLQKVFLEEGSISLLEFVNEENITEVNPLEIKTELLEIKNRVDSVLVSSENVLTKDKTISLTGNVVIDGDLQIQEFDVDNLKVDYLNDEKVELENIIDLQADQNFSKPLVVKKIIVDNLEVSSLCGYNYNNWLRVNDKKRIKFSDIYTKDFSIQNDTIILQNDIILENLITENLNGINAKDFLEDLFIIGKKQVINGNIQYQSAMQAVNLTTNKVNGVPSSELLTKYTKQTLDDVYIDTLEVNHLYVDKINGVPVKEAAMMTKENVIEGKVTIGHLIITDELIVNENISVPFNQSAQLYEQIFIDGNIFIKNLELEPYANLALDTDNVNSYNIDEILENSWSKSRDQIIENSITFKKTASIDELKSQYINDCKEEDFLYVNSQKFNDLDNVTFTNFQFNKIINEKSGIIERVFSESFNELTFYKSVYIKQLSADNIITESYNGIPIEFIMHSNDSYQFTGTTEFEAVRVYGEMMVNNLQMDRLNSQETIAFKEALRLNQNLNIDELRTDSINSRHILVDKLLNENLTEALIALERISNQSDNMHLTIDGDIKVEKNLQVNEINGEPIYDFLEILKNKNFVEIMETTNIKDLLITGDLNVTYLNGQNINDIFAVALSKTKKQSIDKVSVKDASINYLKTEKLNNKNLFNLVYVNEPSTFYGNITFSELFVKGDVITRTLNDKNISTILEELKVIPMKNINSLHVFGNISWNNPSENLHSLSNLFDNAVTKHGDQIINSHVDLYSPITIESLYLEKDDSLVLQKIHEIVSDAVVDSNTNSKLNIKGKKVFKKGLQVGNLEVTNNIDIQIINDIDIIELDSQMYRRYSNDSISAEITFLGQIEIGKLITNNKIHGVSLDNLVTKNKRMPKHLHFEYLKVKNYVTVYQLDGIDFDDFKKKRVSIQEDIEIFGDVEFNKPITVLNGISVSIINGIKPGNLVVNKATSLPNVIYGKKTFASEFFVDGDIETPTINNIHINTMYNNSLLNYQNIEIFGNLIFEADTEILGSVNVSGKVNDLEPQNIVSIQFLQNKWTVGALHKEEVSINNLMNKFENSPNVFVEQLHYLEVDDKLNLQFPRVQNVRSMQIESITRLDIYASEDASFCGLQGDCTCRRQYVAEIYASGKQWINQSDNAFVTFNFYDPNGLFGLRIMSNAVSSSEYCSKNSSIHESSRLLWMKFDDNKKTEIQEPPIQIDGFISDAQIFVVNKKLYLILAIFYDKTERSHAVKSVLYEINLENNQISFLQAILTDGAKSIHIFEIANIGIHALIGCVKGKAESLLLRFDSKTRQFQFIRAFATGGSKYVSSITRDNKYFVILNNPDIDALQIFIYDPIIDNFNDYQNLYFESRVNSLNVFYTGDVGSSEAFIVTTTKFGWFYIYEYMYFGKFQLKLSYWAEDIQVLSPFRYANKNYLFAGFKSNSTIYKVIQQGIH